MTANTQAAPAPALDRVLNTFFDTMTACDLEGTMSYLAPDMACIDATLGWDLDSYETLKGVLTEYMPHWGPPARSYATKILSGETSALVHVVGTPELFGDELRVLAAIDFADGEIVRWVHYWDSTAFDNYLYAQFRTPADSFPKDFKEGQVPTQAAPELVDAATALQQSFGAADASAARDLLHPDVVLVDMALRAQLIGRIETIAYLDRVLDQAPYGRSSELRHVVGGAGGGGFEWTAADGLVGITALEREADGLITRITSVYDSRQLMPARKAALIPASFAP
jgi:ketosteroid isomerase-like protein